MTEREAFEVEFVKLGYQWSDANKDKAFLGWQMASAQAVPPGYVLVPVEPDEMWAHRVIRHHQPNLAVGTRDWCECLEEMLHWHATIAAQGEKP